MPGPHVTPRPSPTSSDRLVDRHEERLNNTSQQFATLAKRVTELEEDLQERDERIAALEDVVATLQDIGGQKTDKEQKIAAIVTYADRVRDAGQDEVAILPKRMMGAAGITERYAYTLIDELHESDAYPWASNAAELPQPSNTGDRRKALLVDFSHQDEAVQEDAEALNKFINGKSAGGASA